MQDSLLKNRWGEGREREIHDEKEEKEKKKNFFSQFIFLFEAYLGIMELSWCHDKFVNVTVQGSLIAQIFWKFWKANSWEVLHVISITCYPAKSLC